MIEFQYVWGKLCYYNVIIILLIIYIKFKICVNIYIHKL